MQDASYNLWLVIFYKFFGKSNSYSMFSLVQVKVKLHTFQLIIEIRNTVNEDLKEKIPAVNSWLIWIIFNFFTITRMSAIPGCPNIFWGNGKISFTEWTYGDLKQAIFFWASLHCSRSILASSSSVVMSLSITLSILVKCHRVNNSK